VLAHAWPSRGRTRRYYDPYNTHAGAHPTSASGTRVLGADLTGAGTSEAAPLFRFGSVRAPKQSGAVWAGTVSATHSLVHVCVRLLEQ
jgi:hypothetical protein